MSDFVRDLEAELISAAHRRAQAALVASHLRPPALLTAALVVAALMITALLPRAGDTETASAFARRRILLFPRRHAAVA